MGTKVSKHVTSLLAGFGHQAGYPYGHRLVLIHRRLTPEDLIAPKEHRLGMSRRADRLGCYDGHCQDIDWIHEARSEPIHSGFEGCSVPLDFKRSPVGGCVIRNSYAPDADYTRGITISGLPVSFLGGYAWGVRMGRSRSSGSS